MAGAGVERHRRHALLVLVGLIAAVSGKYPAYPLPPVQTPVQQAVVSRWRTAAKAASEKATPQLLDFFASAGFRDAIRECCPKAAATAPEELLHRFRAEVRAAELAHAFPSSISTGDQGPLGHDFQIDLGMQYGFFLNGYQADIVLAPSPAPAPSGRLAAVLDAQGNGNTTDVGRLAEEDMFGCPTFKNESSPTWEEAADRLLYVAHNFRQVSFGSNPIFGNAVAIFNTSYVRDMLVMAPIDTGLWEMGCNKSGGAKVDVNCAAWEPRTMGTYEHFDHLIVPNWDLWREDQATGNLTSIYTQVRETFERSPFAEGKYTQLPNITNAAMLKYWETNLLGNPRFPEGVRFLIGDFHELFGTADGKSLQALCDHFGWPLAWALTLNRTEANGPDFLSNVSYPLNERVLDPSVAAAAELRTPWPPQAKDNFAELWQTVSSARNASSENDWSRWWDDLVAHQIRVAPATAAVCQDVDACVGIDVDAGHCICRTPWDVVPLVV